MEYESFLKNNLRLRNLKERAFDTPEICVGGQVGDAKL